MARKKCEDCKDYNAIEGTCWSRGGSCGSPINPVGGLYDDLIHRVYNAWEEQMKEKVKANVVIINGKKYGKLAEFMFDHRYCSTPTLFGLNIGVDMQMDDDFDFFVSYLYDPPITEYDKRKEEYDALEERVKDLRDAIHSAEKILGIGEYD